MKIFVFMFLLLLALITNPVKAQTDQTPSAIFKAEVFNTDTSGEEADLKIITVSENSFKLAPGDLIHINFAKTAGITPEVFQLEDIITGKILYWELDLNNESIEWYMVTDHNLDHRPRFKAKEMTMIKYGLLLIFVFILILLEKLRQQIKARKLNAAIQSTDSAFEKELETIDKNPDI